LPQHARHYPTVLMPLVFLTSTIHSHLCRRLAAATGLSNLHGCSFGNGFIDRYSGHRLVFPPVFRVLSVALPTDFPYHRNWKADVTHQAYYELAATIDHLLPVTRGGADDESNWITTSMAHHSAKMNWTLDECGWKLHPSGQLAKWDGPIPSLCCRSTVLVLRRVRTFQVQDLESASESWTISLYSVGIIKKLHISLGCATGPKVAGVLRLRSTRQTTPSSSAIQLIREIPIWHLKACSSRLHC
jgi:hypothetical protein